MKAGKLRFSKPNKYWVETSQKRVCLLTYWLPINCWYGKLWLLLFIILWAYAINLFKITQQFERDHSNELMEGCVLNIFEWLGENKDGIWRAFHYLLWGMNSFSVGFFYLLAILYYNLCTHDFQYFLWLMFIILCMMVYLIFCTVCAVCGGQCSWNCCWL